MAFPEVQPQGEQEDALVIGPQADAVAPRPIQRIQTQGTNIVPDVVWDVTGELVKSYGWKRDRETGTWDWSVDNITDQFEKEPFWTAIDYITLGFAPARWGLAAGKMALGSSAIAKSYRAGEVSMRGAIQFANQNKALGAGLRGRVARQFATTNTTQASGLHRLGQGRYAFDPEFAKYSEIVGKYGNENEQRFVAQIFRNEYNMERAAFRQEGQRIQRALTRGDFSEEAQTHMTRALAINPATASAEELTLLMNARRFLAQDNAAERMFKSQKTFRDRITAQAVDAGMLPAAAARRPWDPRIYEEFGLQKGGGSFMERTLKTAEDVEASGLTLLESNRFLSTEQMLRVSDTVSHQRYALKVSMSPLMVSADDIIAKHGAAEAAEIMRAWPTLAEAARFPGLKAPPGSQIFPGQFTKKSKTKLAGLQKQRDQLITDAKSAGGFDRRGYMQRFGVRNSDLPKPPEGFVWNGANLVPKKGVTPGKRATSAAMKMQAEAQRRRAIAKGASVAISRHRNTLKKVDREIAREKDKLKIPEHLKSLPESITEMRIDPAIADDVIGALNVLGNSKQNPFVKAYFGMQGFFKAGHTAYNPSTTSRNFLGNIVFSMFALGGDSMMNIAKFGPLQGYKALRDQTPDMYDFMRRGGLGGGADRELKALRDRVFRDTKKTAAQARGKFKGAAGEEALEMLDANESWLGAAFQSVGGDTWAPGLTAKAVKTGAWFERTYGMMDEVWKMNVFTVLKGKQIRKGMSEIEAGDFAFREVQRYMPNYSNVSTLIENVRDHLPFVSFPAEAIRVWKNAMIYKPHLAVMVNQAADMTTAVSASIAGFTPEEVEAARESMPWYTQNKQMALLPWRSPASGKPQFLDLTYLIPMSDMGAEAQTPEGSFLGLPMPMPINPGTNPFIQLSAAAITGVDPFTEREIEPRFTEQKLGIAVRGPGARHFVGMVEMLAKTMAPPVIPPGYVGTNLWELWSGEKSGITGKELEQGVTRTMLRELSGLRTYEPSVDAQIINIRREQRLKGESGKQAWDRWEIATANGDVEGVAAAQQELNEIYADKPGYFEKNFQKHLPGGYMNLSRKDIAEVLRRSARFDATPEELMPIYLRSMTTSRPQRRRRRRRRR